MGTATTFVDLIASPSSEKVFLAEIKAAEEVTNFALTAAQTYTYELSYLNETITLADSKTEIIRKAVVSCELDGTALTVKTSIATVEGTAGTYWHDTANALLYIHPPDDGSPNHHTVIAYFWLYFATKGIILDSRYYEPYVSDRGIPQISQETQAIHWGICKISSGAVELLNGRGYFDQIAKKFIWANKTCKILLGGDLLPYAEYTTIFSAKIFGTSFTSGLFILELESKSFDLLRILPINNFWVSTWANLDPAAEGRPIPYYWGNYDATQAPIVTCINSAYAVNTYQFKICDTTFHAITSITQVYVDFGAGAGWGTIAHANEDLAQATFTIDSASFVFGVSRVKVSFQGYHSGGILIDGAPEVAEDILLNQCGYVSADLNAASFTASKATSDCVLNVSVENEISALTIMETICKSDLAFLDEDGSGLLRYRTWEPVATGTIPVIAKEDIFEPTIEEDATEIYWKVKVGYSWQSSIAEYLYTEESNNLTRYKYGRNDHLTYDTYLRNKSNADVLAARINWITREPSPILNFSLKASQITKTLGDKLKVTLARSPYATAGGYIERVFEIIEKNISCFPLVVNHRARDLMDYGSNVGFWMGASAPDWDDATQQQREDSGFWCDANGYADSTNWHNIGGNMNYIVPESIIVRFLGGRTDRNGVCYCPSHLLSSSI